MLASSDNRLWANSTLVFCRGRLVQDRNLKGPKLNCRNWECGVIVPAFAGNEEMPVELVLVGGQEKDSLTEVFGGILPVPMRYPTGVVAADGGRPWFFSETGKH